MRSNLAWGVVFVPYLRRVKMPWNLERIGSGAVAATPATVSLITVECGGEWRAWVQIGEGVGGSALWLVVLAPLGVPA